MTEGRARMAARAMRKEFMMGGLVELASGDRVSSSKGRGTNSTNSLVERRRSQFSGSASHVMGSCK